MAFMDAVLTLNFDDLSPIVAICCIFNSIHIPK